MIFQKNYKTNLSATLQATNIGEIEVKLSIEPLSDIGFLLFEPGTAKEETCFYHRKVGTSAFIYGVNRDNPQQHILGASVMLTNSIDGMNYIVDLLSESTYIFKTSTSNLIIKGGKFYINNTLYTIADVDTSVVLENKVLIPNNTNYVYIKDNDYYINEVYDATLYPIADIVVDAGGVIQSITKHKFKDLLNAKGYAPLDNQEKIPFQYLPAVFASIEEYATIGNFPAIGQPGILYTVIGSSIAYRWDGDSYVAMTGIGDMFSGNNLSELTDIQDARDNLNVYSQIETDEKYLFKLENLDDLQDKETARNNLDVYSKSETDNITESALYNTFTAGENLSTNDFFRFGGGIINETISLPSSYVTISAGTTGDIINFTCDSNYYSIINSITIGVSGNLGNADSGYFIITNLSNNILYTSDTQSYSSQTTKTYTFTGVNLIPGNYKLRYKSNGGQGTLVCSPNGSYNFILQGNEYTNKVYKANSSSQLKSKVEGITTGNILLGDSFKGKIYGYNDNFSGLISGKRIYLNDIGGVSIYPGTYLKCIGSSFSSTEILFDPLITQENNTYITLLESNNIHFSSDVESSSVNNPSSPVKVKEIYIGNYHNGGTITVDFTLRCSGYYSGSGTHTVSAKIYKNGVQYGTLRTISTTTPPSSFDISSTFSETLSFSSGDLIQIYITSTGYYSGGTVKNFRLKYDEVFGIPEYTGKNNLGSVII